jgi:eukaryotic-like serine/threonine-protein kinase
MPEAELKTLGRYTIERTLGKGAMGVVYEGVDPKLNRRVAIKTILKSHLDPDTAKDYSMRFSREAQAVARLNHPHIVQVYDFAEEGDIAYLVMEFIRGKELKNFFDANERFDIREAVRIMCELLDALEFAHNAGIIHRDIKPANVMLDAQARTKLTDFGVARVQDSDRTQHERTQAGTMVGTPAYMSPEQITGANIDKRSDVFSAGIILYQFLTGEKPFTGGGAWTIAKKIIQEDPPLPSSLNNAVTPYFDAVVNKALSKNPDTRYQSAKDFGVALKRALEGKGEEDDTDKTIVGDLTVAAPAPRAPQPRPSAAMGTGTGTQTGTAAGNQEVELEFWRAIKDGNDPDDFDLYVQQFPNGIYAALAKRKIAKLRGAADDETSAEAKKQEKKEAEEAARKEAEARVKLAEEKEKLELELARKEEEFQRREAEREVQEKARLEAIEKAKQEAAAERERARLEAENAKQEAEKARLEAIEKAKQEAAAERERVRLEAEKARQEAEKLRQEAELKARQEAAAAAERAKLELAAERERARNEAEKAKKEAAAAAEKAKLEAEKARREAEERAKKETEAFAKKQAEERAKREAEFKKREAELKAQAAAGGKKTSPAVLIGIPAIIIAMAGAGWYYLAPDDAVQKARIAAMQRQLEEAKRQAEEAGKAKKAAEEARVALEKAKQAEEEARKRGDSAAQKKLAEERLRAEEAKKSADAASKARDAEAKKTADAAKAVQDKATAAEKARAEKLAQEKAEKDRIAAEKDRERLAREKATAERAVAEAKAAADRAKAEAERQIAEAKAATEKAKAEAEKAKLAAAAPAAPQGGEALFEQGSVLEQQGKGNDAVKVYVRAARSGNGKAAKRLGEIYDKGIAGVSRDYAESLKWYNAARVLGEEVPMAKSR